jgi:nucleoside-diphosphate-sugar epimerase
VTEDTLKHRPEALVLGGLGYLGQAVCGSLIRGGFRVTCLDSRLHGQDASPELAGNPAFTLAEGDIRDMRLMERLVRSPELIIVLAALVGEAACDRDPEETLQTNLLAPLSVREAALHHGRAERLVFASTDSCYGKRPGETLYEDSPLKPVSLYASLKASAEERLLDCPRGRFPKTVVLRLATLYGLAPRMRFDLAANLLTREAAVKRKLTVFSGEQWRPLVHVRDAAEAFLAAASAPLRTVAGEVFNVGTNGQNVRFRELGELIASLCPGSELVFQPGEPDLRDYRVDFTKIRENLGWEASTTLSDGIGEIRDAVLGGLFPDPYSPAYRNS